MSLQMFQESETDETLKSLKKKTIQDIWSIHDYCLGKYGFEFASGTCGAFAAELLSIFLAFVKKDERERALRCAFEQVLSKSDEISKVMKDAGMIEDLPT